MIVYIYIYINNYIIVTYLCIVIVAAVPRLLGKLLDQSPSSDTCPAGISNSTMSSLAMVVLGGGLASFIRTTMLNQAEDSIASRLRSKAFGALLTRRNLEDFQIIVEIGRAHV